MKINLDNMGRTFLKGIILLVFFGCNSESAPDCLQTTGEVSRLEVIVPDFTKITVFENVSLVLKQGAVQQVEVETGENLREEVTAVVEGDRLLLRDTNDCNFVRSYGTTKVYVTSPNIEEVRSSTGWSVTSDGVLGYDSLTLVSESFNNTESETTDGLFDLEVATQNLTVVSNGIAYFKLSGSTQALNLTVAAGDTRIEADNLIAQRVGINHRGSNDMLVNPQQSITGLISGTGDVISSNRPAEISVDAIYKGKLVFR